MEEVILKVSEALPEHVGSNRACLDKKNRADMDVSPGDIIEIKGKHKTAAVVWRARKTDEGKGFISIDNLTRKNAQVDIGGRVAVRKIVPQVAKKVIMAPAISQGQRIQFGTGIEHLVKRGLLKRPVCKGDTLVIPGIALFGNSLPFAVLKTKPKDIVIIGERTEVEVEAEAAQGIVIDRPKMSYDKIGGLSNEIMKIREMIELPLKHPELFKRLGIDSPQNVLLHGPPGTGKTLLAKAVANESGINSFIINGLELLDKFYSKDEEILLKIFEEAEKNTPAIVFIDKLDAVASRLEGIHGDIERRVVSQLLALLERVKEYRKINVIGATNRVDLLDPSIRFPNFFDREIVIGVPDREGRKEILNIHTQGVPMAENVNLDELAEITNDFVGTDLVALVREAAMNALHRYLPGIDPDKPIPTDILEKMEVNMDDFKEAHHCIKDIVSGISSPG